MHEPAVLLRGDNPSYPWRGCCVATAELGGLMARTTVVPGARARMKTACRSWNWAGLMAKSNIMSALPIGMKGVR